MRFWREGGVAGEHRTEVRMRKGTRKMIVKLCVPGDQNRHGSSSCFLCCQPTSPARDGLWLHLS